MRDLGVIEDLSLTFGAGMTVLTGETGAGKTLVVEALQLVLGGRANPAIVRAGATEALVEARFVVEEPEGEREVIIARAVPADGRSRAWVDGRMSPVSALSRDGLGAGRDPRPARPPVARHPGGPTRRPRRLCRHRHGGGAGTAGPAAGDRGVGGRAGGRRAGPGQGGRRAALPGGGDRGGPPVRPRGGRPPAPAGDPPG